MYTVIAEELDKAGQNVERERLLAITPLYLCSAGQGSREILGNGLEELLKKLEEQKLFARQTDGVVCFSLEYGIQEGHIRETLGLSDGQGRFRESLGQWMSYLNGQYQVVGGIVQIRMDWSRQWEAEDIWWRRFFRELGRYKKEFLFLFQAEEEALAAAGEWLGREYFCRTIEVRRPESADYIRRFKQELDRAGLILDEAGEEVLAELLGQYTKELDYRILEKWQKELAWEYLILANPGTVERHVFPAERITEESLKRHLPDRRKSSGIGIKINEKEAAGRR